MSRGELPVLRVVSAEIHRDGRYLITQRSSHGVLPLLWEFPGGRVREGETDGQALRRSVRERIGVEVEVQDLLMEVDHAYDEYRVCLAVYRCGLGGSEPRAAAVSALAWVKPDEFADYPFPGADQQTVDQLLQEA